MLNIWNDPYKIPILNYYKAFDDPKFLLKKPKKLNIVEVQYIYKELIILQDWFARELDENEYSERYRQINKLLLHKFRMSVLKNLYSIIENVNILDTNVDWIIGAEKTDTLKETLKVLNLPFFRNIVLLQKNLKQSIDILDADIQFIENEMDRSGNEKNDYMKIVAHLKMERNIDIRPTKTTLYEWANILKNMKSYERRD